MATPSIGVQTNTGMINVTIKGMDQVEKNLKVLREALGVKTGGLINRGLMKGAQIIKAEARNNAPVFGGEANSRQAKKLIKSFRERIKHQAGRPLSMWANQRIPGNLKHNIVAHYVRKLPLTVWIRVRTKSWIFAPRYSTESKRWGVRGGADPSNLVGNPNYWWLVEFGARGRPGVGFMRKAFESKKQEAAKIAVEAMNKEIETVCAKFGVRLPS
jgi:HK97 gp10 family phage protein